MAAFPEVALGGHTHVLSLHDYLTRSPERFFSKEALAAYGRLLCAIDASDSAALADYLNNRCPDLNRAVGFLAEINRQEWHERQRATEEYEIIRFLDRSVLPGYLRLVEGILFPMLHLAACFSRRARGRSQEGLDVYNAVEELRGGPLGALTIGYRNTVRNGIAHGGITYGQGCVTLRDGRGDEEVLSFPEVTDLVDRLVDTCNGMSLALKIFFSQQGPERYRAPRELMLHELRSETSAPWWQVEWAVESQANGRSQLTVFARSRTRDVLKAQHSACQTGALAELLVPGYQRYFVSIRSRVAWAGWAAFDGTRLREIRESGPVSMADYSPALEGKRVFYVPQPRLPRILGKVDTYRRSLLLQWPLAMSEIRRNLGLAEISVRTVAIHRTRAHAVLRATVVLAPIGGALDQDAVRGACRRIIGTAARTARRTCRPLSPLRVLPLGYARVGVFQRDHRERELVSYGLGPDLVGTVQIQQLTRISAPDIAGASIEVQGRYRIAWNRAWLTRKESG